MCSGVMEKNLSAFGGKKLLKKYAHKSVIILNIQYDS